MGFIFVILGLIITVLWSLLPFAVFGIKQRLDKIIEELTKLNSKIAEFEKEITTIKIQTQEQPAQTNKNGKKNENIDTNDNSRYMPKP